MKREEVIRIGKRFMNDEYSYTYGNNKYSGIENYNNEALLISCIKSDFRRMLGICGCGNPEVAMEGIYNLLTLIKNKSDITSDGLTKEQIEENNQAYKKLVGIGDPLPNWSILTILYMLDDKDFIEHGSNIFWSWITDLGEDYLKIFEDRDFNWEE